MAKRIRDVGVTFLRVNDTGTRQPVVDPDQVAEAIGARVVGNLDQGGNPMSLFGLREQLLSRRVSRGGRPTLEGTTRRQKIPLTEQQWEELDILAHLLKETGVPASPGQVASLLISLGLRHIRSEVIEASNEQPSAKRGKKAAKAISKS